MEEIIIDDTFGIPHKYNYALFSYGLIGDGEKVECYKLTRAGVFSINYMGIFDDELSLKKHIQRILLQNNFNSIMVKITNYEKGMYLGYDAPFMVMSLFESTDRKVSEEIKNFPDPNSSVYWKDKCQRTSQ